MKGLQIIPLLIILSVLGWVAAGCSSESPTPQQIAAYPQSPGEDWYLPAKPDRGRLVYDAYLALDTRDPEAAAAEASRITQDLGGYLVNSYTSFSNGRATVTLELRIPPYNFESARRSFRNLGVLVRETVTGEWEGERSGWEQYAQFTLFFRRQGATFSPGLLMDWRPVETLRQAVAVSIRLLGYILDFLIWVVVILGPFALIGYGIARLVRRLKSSAPAQAPEPSSDLLSGPTDNSPETGGSPDA